MKSLGIGTAQPDLVPNHPRRVLGVDPGMQIHVAATFTSSPIRCVCVFRAPGAALYDADGELGWLSLS